MRILYVEDHRDTASAIRILLEQRGHQVMVAMTAREAKKLCVEHLFDVWILDIQLPDAHGGELLKSLRRVSDAKAIALTGCGTTNEIAEGRDDGFDDYLLKPVEMDKVFQAVEN